MIMLLIVIASALWVIIDAKSIGVKKGLVTGIGNMGAWGWFSSCLLLWIIGFPMYLYYRGKFKTAIATIASRNKVNTETPMNHSLNDLEQLATLKGKGIITELEFQAKMKQILGV